MSWLGCGSEDGLDFDLEFDRQIRQRVVEIDLE
jgi:hypothetical protein